MNQNVVSEQHIQAVVFCFECKCCHFWINWPDTLVRWTGYTKIELSRFEFFFGFATPQHTHNPSSIMSAQLYYCGCPKPFTLKSNMVKHARKKGCNPPPVPKKRKATTSPWEDFLDGIPGDLKDVEPRWCRQPGCLKDDLGYGVQGGDKISCSDHNDGLVAIGGLCCFRGCTTKGTLKIEDKRETYRFCSTHLKQLQARGLPMPEQPAKKPWAKMCAADGCQVRPSCDGGKFCKTHSISGKSDDRRRCDFQGCTSEQRPSFGFEGGRRTRCREHKEEGMVSRKICQEESCNVSASFGVEGGVATHCKSHAPDGAYLVNASTCAHESCNKQPIFGESGVKKPTHCKAHAPAGYVDVKNKRCTVVECGKLCVDSAAFCVAHGGGKKCSMECCAYGGPRAQHRHPDNMSWICAFATRVLMETAYMNNDNDRVRMLLKHFGRKNILVLNQQSAFRTEIEKLYWPKLHSCCEICFDEPVSEQPKTLYDYRPDIFYKWCVNDVHYGIHIEYDEGTGHEDDDARLKCIARSARVEGRTYVIRVSDSTADGPLCDRRQNGGVVYFETNAVGKYVAEKVAQAVMQRIGWIKDGLAPDDRAQRPYKLYM